MLQHRTADLEVAVHVCRRDLAWTGYALHSPISGLHWGEGELSETSTAPLKLCLCRSYCYTDRHRWRDAVDDRKEHKRWDARHCVDELDSKRKRPVTGA